MNLKGRSIQPLISTNDSNRFCGPAVIAAVLNKPIDDVMKIVQTVTGRNEITWMYSSEVERVLHLLGVKSMRRLPIKGSLFYNLHTLPEGLYILMPPGHFICIEILTVGSHREVWFIDNYTKKPINALASARLMQPIKYCLEIKR